MGVTNILQRRIKPIKDASDDEETNSILPESQLESDNPDSDNSVSSTSSSQGGRSHQHEQHKTKEDGTTHQSSDTDANSDSDDDNSPEPREEDITSISFGALAKAQESLGNLKRKRGDFDYPSTSKNPRLDPDPESHQSQRFEARKPRPEQRDLSRSSKHAPAEQTSKKPVTRRREVVPPAKLQRRDPRFEFRGGEDGRVDEERIKKNYAFLDTYRESEMAELRSAIRAAKDADEDTKADLKRALLVMESRKKAQDAKELRQGVMRAHRTREKELVKQGKKPFYLKKAELQKRALVEKFEALGEKRVDKVIERRRKKLDASDRKRIPEERGTRGGDGGGGRGRGRGGGGGRGRGRGRG